MAAHPGPARPAPAQSRTAHRQHQQRRRLTRRSRVRSDGPRRRRRQLRHQQTIEPGSGRGPGRAQRPRDPQARREALANAAIEIIAEVGIGRATHRAVAARADLPLGATTYYFPSLDALIGAGLEHATEALQADLRAWADRLRDSPDLAATLAGLAEECLADRRRAQIEYELYVAAARDAALRPLATGWLDGMRALLLPYVDLATANSVSALLDGAMLQSLVSGDPLDVPALTDAIRRLTAP
jgi:DNA-binding transcriptional regulator YbjK